MIAICPAGPPKLMKPSLSQKPSASLKEIDLFIVAGGGCGGQLRSLGPEGLRAAPPLFWAPFSSLVPAVLAGLGRAPAEVGAVMIVGGNIDGVTRVMTTAIALETSKGDLPLALGLGIILIAIVIAVNAGAYLTKELAQRRYG